MLSLDIGGLIMWVNCSMKCTLGVSNDGLGGLNTGSTVRDFMNILLMPSLQLLLKLMEKMKLHHQTLIFGTWCK